MERKNDAPDWIINNHYNDKCNDPTGRPKVLTRQKTSGKKDQINKLMTMMVKMKKDMKKSKKRKRKKYESSSDESSENSSDSD